MFTGGKLPEKIEQVVIRGVAVPFPARHQHRRQHLFRIDERQIDGHVDIGTGRNGVAELHLGRDQRFDHRRIVNAGMAVAREDRADHCLIPIAPGMRAQLGDAVAPPLHLRCAFALVRRGCKDQPVHAFRHNLRKGSDADAAGRFAKKMKFAASGFGKN